MNTEEWTRIAALSTLADITGKFGHVAWVKLGRVVGGLEDVS